MKRLATALIGLPVLFVVIKWMPPAVFLVLVLCAVAQGCREFYALAEKNGLRPHRLLGASLGVATAYTFYDPRLAASDVLCAAAILVPLASLWRRGRDGAAGAEGEFAAVAVTCSAVLFVGLLMGYCLGLLDDGGETGRDLTVLLFWVVWLSDAAAYAAGSLWGRRKLAPSVSPAKTIEGAVGALAAAVAAAWVARAWFFRRLDPADAIALGLLLGVAGMLGDLAESLMKRSAAVKDSGRLFPGHGGLLDRADSLLFAAPVLFYYHRFFME